MSKPGDASNTPRPVVCTCVCAATVLCVDKCLCGCNGAVRVLFSFVCFSSLFLQELKPVLGIVWAAVTGIDGLAVICEKHQVPIADPGDDGVQVLHFTFQQHHSGTLPAVLAGMVQHHVEEVLKLGGDA